MTAYYNENEPYAAEWLRNLIKEGLIADGHVDDRSIEEVTPADLADYRQCHFFAGLGGWSGALRLAGIPDDTPLWTGSCPCQPFSLAGRQGGFDDRRHLWPDWFYLIGKCRPAIILGEQVASAGEWLRLVRGDLEALDYAVGVIPLEAASAGAYHFRDRYWFVANRDPARLQGRPLLPERAGQRPARADGVGHAESSESGTGFCESNTVEHGNGPASAGDNECWVVGADGKARRVEPGIRLLAHGVPQRVAKLRALGNAIDLRPAAAFIRAAL